MAGDFSREGNRGKRFFGIEIAGRRLRNSPLVSNSAIGKGVLLAGQGSFRAFNPVETFAKAGVASDLFLPAEFEA
jgi:hypothetical protein